MSAETSVIFIFGAVFKRFFNSFQMDIIIIIISGFGIYGAAVVPDSGVGNTWQRLTLVCVHLQIVFRPGVSNILFLCIPWVN